MDKLNLMSWVGRDTSDTGSVTAADAAKIHAALGDPETPAPKSQDPLPGLWHWCAMPPLTASIDLGRDGHPGPGELLPPIRFSRRMWAGGSLRFHAPLSIDDPLKRRSAVRSIQEKDSATGPMVVVTVDHAIFGPRGLAIEERQDIVFLDVPKTFTPPRKRSMPQPVAAEVAITAPLLFRYSAVTFNAHRIHYDVDYTREVEKYPDLVVHGPLQASLLMQHACAHHGSMPREFSFRSLHPMFAHGDMQIATEEEDGVLTLYAGQDGHQCMLAHAIWDGVQ